MKVGIECQKLSDLRVTYPIPMKMERRYRMVEGCRTTRISLGR